MKKRMIIMLIALTLLFGGIIGFHLIKAMFIKRFFASYEAPPITVSSLKAIQRAWLPRIHSVANFVAEKGVEVNSQASGKVVKIHFDSGQYIQENQPLIDIDDNIDQATLRFNQADMALKKINYQRQLDLLKHAATSTSSVDEAKANLAQAQANIDKIQAQIKQKHIVAPFSGHLGIRQINLGQYISPGQTAIVSLQSLDPLFLEFNLPEQQFKLIHVNQGVEFTTEAYPDLLFRGNISAINSKIDTNTHTILVQATLPNCPAAALSPSALKNTDNAGFFKTIVLEKNGKTSITCDSALNKKNAVSNFAFIPGMFASIAIELPSISDVIVLPSTAISFSLYGNAVFSIEETAEKKKTPEGKEIFKVKRVFVNTGEQDGNDTVIYSGIKSGQQVVSSGEFKLQNDASVVINNTIPLNAETNTATLGH